MGRIAMRPYIAPHAALRTRSGLRSAVVLSKNSQDWART